MHKEKGTDAIAALFVGILATIGIALFVAVVAIPAAAMGWSPLGIGISVGLGLFALALLTSEDFADTVGLALYGFVFYVFPALAIIGLIIAVWIDLI